MRQKIRKGILIFSALMFPFTFFFLSPFIIVVSASQGIFSGSAIVFGLMLVFSLVSSRLYCGWLCPGGAVQDYAAEANGHRWNSRWKNGLKYGIWLVWFSFIVYLWITHRPLTVNFAFQWGIDLQYLMIYAIVMLVILSLSLFTGKRGMCHSFCWMAPFMVIGEKLADWLHIPRFRLKAAPDKCVSCGKCTKNCPMSLDVQKMITSGMPDSTECIHCLTCVDGCQQHAIRCGILPKQRGQ